MLETYFIYWHLSLGLGTNDLGQIIASYSGFYALRWDLKFKAVMKSWNQLFFFVAKLSETDRLLAWMTCCLDRRGVNCVMHNVSGKKCLEFINLLYHLQSVKSQENFRLLWIHNETTLEQSIKWKFTSTIREKKTKMLHFKAERSL